MADDSEAPLDELCDDIIERYHTALHRALPLIADELAALAASSASPSMSAMREAFSDLAEQIEAHLAKEENLLFPALHALADADQPGAVRASQTFVTVLHPIRLMEAEHVRIELALDRLRELALTVSEPDTLSPAWHRCMTDLSKLDAELREHHRTENEVLFPRALELERSIF